MSKHICLMVVLILLAGCAAPSGEPWWQAFTPSHNSPTQFNFDWHMAGDTEIAPLQVFDDGRRSWLQYPANSIVPAIFARSGQGDRLLRPEMHGDYAVLDRVYEQLVLRGGHLQVLVWRDQKNRSAATRASSEANESSDTARIRPTAQIPESASSPKDVSAGRLDLQGQAAKGLVQGPVQIYPPLPQESFHAGRKQLPEPVTGKSPRLVSGQGVRGEPPRGASVGSVGNTSENPPAASTALAIGDQGKKARRAPGDKPAAAKPQPVSGRDAPEQNGQRPFSAPGTTRGIAAGRNSDAAEPATATAVSIKRTPKLVFAVTPADGNIRRALGRWAKNAGWTFTAEHWDVDVDIPLAGSAHFGDSFRASVRELLAATELGDRPLQPCFYSNQVLRVVPLAQRCDRTRVPGAAPAGTSNTGDETGLESIQNRSSARAS